MTEQKNIIEKPIMMTAKEVAAALCSSESYAYVVIRQLNRELADKGYLTVKGKVNRKYFLEKCYGASNA